MDQPTAEAMLRELDRFVGEWTMTAGPPGGPPWPGEARVRFAWIVGGAFLAERWRLDASGLPEGTPTSGTSVYGCDAAHGAYSRLSHDDRGVCRVYELGLCGGVWTLRREDPPFAQRSRGSFRADGRTITSRWELQEPGEAWQTDFDATCTRVASAARAPLVHRPRSRRPILGASLIQVRRAARGPWCPATCRTPRQRASRAGPAARAWGGRPSSAHVHTRSRHRPA